MPIFAGDTTCSMKLPISMCATYSADFDVDEISTFPVRTHKAIQEYKVTIWDNVSHIPYIVERYNTLVHRMSPLIGTKSSTMSLASTIY